MDHETLSTTFTDALRYWKPQTISFLDLPGELRNHIYNLVISNTNQHYTELSDLDLNEPLTLPPVALMFTCRSMQREILPIYFRTINLRLKCPRGRHPPSIDNHVPGLHPAVKQLRYYTKLDPTIADHLLSIRLESSIIDCNIKIIDSRAVHVELFASNHWISSNTLSFMSVAIRDKILDSLVDSPTGLLGVRHLSIAHEEIHQIWEWGEWKQQEQEREFQKYDEAEEYFQEFCCCCESINFLIEQAEEEGIYQNA
jgi:hypothetical protein